MICDLCEAPVGVADVYDADGLRLRIGCESCVHDHEDTLRSAVESVHSGQCGAREVRSVRRARRLTSIGVALAAPARGGAGRSSRDVGTPQRPGTGISQLTRHNSELRLR